MSQAEESCQGDPEFITYLLSPEVKHDTYFLVGKNKVEGHEEDGDDEEEEEEENKKPKKGAKKGKKAIEAAEKKAPPKKRAAAKKAVQEKSENEDEDEPLAKKAKTPPTERIGAVRKMLAAHSIVFRAELEDSDLKEKGEITVKDIFPDTFRNLLKFVYGYNNTQSLTFEAADDLLYAADKYSMEKLKKQLALRLMPLLNSQNICSLLNNPACHTVLELNAKITEILQWETHDVLASPPFIHLRVEGVVKILEQECLNVPEIQLFRSALTWAKNKVTCEDENQLRRQFEELKHIRIRTISLQDFVSEVVPSGILSKDEVFQSCILYGKGETPPAIDGFSNNIEPRLDSTPLELNIPEDTLDSTCQLKSVSLVIYTESSAVGLLPLEIQANGHSSSDHYRCVCDVEILNTSVPPVIGGATPITVKFDQLVACGQIFKISLEKNGLYLKLLPKTSCTIKMTFNEPHRFDCAEESYFSNNDLSLESLTFKQQRSRPHRYNDENSVCFPFTSLKYLKLNQT